MISCFWIFFGWWLIFLAFIVDGGIVGSKASQLIKTKNGISELCQVMKLGGETMSSGLDTVLSSTDGNVTCLVGDECQSLKCLSSNKTLRFGIKLKNVCQGSQTVWKLGVEGDSVVEGKWVLNVPLFLGNSDSVRHRIAFESGALERIMFLKVVTVSRRRDVDDNVDDPILTSDINLESCETELESSCLSFPLFVLPYLHFDACDHDQTKYLSRNRSSRSLSAVEMHTHQRNTLPAITSPIGRPCNFSIISSCGDKGACANRGDGKGVCECIDNFLPNVDGKCVDPVHPIPTPADHNKSYSATLGALFSIFILLAIAAAVFFGTKYEVFQHLRNRLPLSLRCWPFPMLRRTRADDNVSLVYPIDEDVDDEPLLL